MKYISIFSTPRSGSSWVGQLLNSSPEVVYRFQPNFAYSFKHTLSKNANKEEIQNFIEALIKSNDPFVNAEISISSKSNVLFKKSSPKLIVSKETHYIYLIETLLKNSNTQVIGLIRSPFATLNSWLNTPKEFDKKWSVKQEWKKASLKNQSRDYNYFGYEKWKEVARLFVSIKNNYPNRFYLLEYEDLLKNNLETVSSLFKFCNLEVTKQTLDFLLESTNIQEQDAYSVFKKKENDMAWKKELPQFIIDEISNDDDFKKLNEIFQWI